MAARAGADREAATGSRSRNHRTDLLGDSEPATTASRCPGIAAFGLGLGGAAALEQMGRDARICCRRVGSSGRGRRRWCGLGFGLLARRLGSLEEVLWDLSHAMSPLLLV